MIPVVSTSHDRYHSAQQERAQQVGQTGGLHTNNATFELSFCTSACCSRRAASRGAVWLSLEASHLANTLRSMDFAVSTVTTWSASIYRDTTIGKSLYKKLNRLARSRKYSVTPCTLSQRRVRLVLADRPIKENCKPADENIWH